MLIITNIIFSKCCKWHVCKGWGQGGGGVGYTHKHVIHDFKYYEQMSLVLSQMNCMLSFCNCEDSSNHTSITFRSMSRHDGCLTGVLLQTSDVISNIWSSQYIWSMPKQCSYVVFSIEQIDISFHTSLKD